MDRKQLGFGVRHTSKGRVMRKLSLSLNSNEMKATACLCRAFYQIIKRLHRKASIDDLLQLPAGFNFARTGELHRDLRSLSSIGISRFKGFSDH